MQIALSGTLNKVLMVQYTENDRMFAVSRRDDSAPRSSPVLRFVPGGVQITTQGKKYRTGDEHGALFCRVAVPTCPATWPHGHRRGCRRSFGRATPWAVLPCHFEPWRLTSNSRTPLSSERHGRSSQ
jgi:hypothetical protein